MQLEELKVGSASQILQRNRSLDSSKFPQVSVRCIKKNGHVWTGAGEETMKIFDGPELLSFLHKDFFLDAPEFNENPMSIALHLKYGQFSYFTGGDMTGLQGYGLPVW